jgi:hypothetical protein
VCLFVRPFGFGGLKFNLFSYAVKILSLNSNLIQIDLEIDEILQFKPITANDKSLTSSFEIDKLCGSG